MGQESVEPNGSTFAEKRYALMWMQQFTRQLGTLHKSLKAGIETLERAGKKSESSLRLSQLQSSLAKVRRHRTLTERVLILLENDEVTGGQLQRLKDGLRYFLEFLQDPNFADNLDMYDGLPLYDIPDLTGTRQKQRDMHHGLSRWKVDVEALMEASQGAHLKAGSRCGVRSAKRPAMKAPTPALIDTTRVLQRIPKITLDSLMNTSVSQPGDKAMGQRLVPIDRPAADGGLGDKPKTYAQCLSAMEIADLPPVHSTVPAETPDNLSHAHHDESDFQLAGEHPAGKFAHLTLQGDTGGPSLTVDLHHPQNSCGLPLLQKAQTDDALQTTCNMSLNPQDIVTDKGSFAGIGLKPWDQCDIPVSMPAQKGAGVTLPSEESPASELDEDMIPEATQIVLRMVEEVMSGQEEAFLVPDEQDFFDLTAGFKMPSPTKAQHPPSVFSAPLQPFAQCVPDITAEGEGAIHGWSFDKGFPADPWGMNGRDISEASKQGLHCTMGDPVSESAPFSLRSVLADTEPMFQAPRTTFGSLPALKIPTESQMITAYDRNYAPLLRPICTVPSIHQFLPTNPAYQTMIPPPSYPTAADVPDIIKSGDVLFRYNDSEGDPCQHAVFAFYYQQGTLQQLLAAERLKQQGWTYHTELKKWYKAVNNCTQVTNDYEEGQFMYFDHNLIPPEPRLRANRRKLARKEPRSCGQGLDGWTVKTTGPHFAFNFKYLGP